MSIIPLLLAASFTLTSPPALEWSQVTTNAKETISGIVHWETNRFLVVHDNKEEKDVKLSFLQSSGSSWKLSPLTLSDPKKLTFGAQGTSELRDLEGVTLIPGRTGEVLVIGNKGSEDGWIYDLKITGNTAEVVDAFRAPGAYPDSDFESIQAFSIDQRLILVWADRGTARRPATIWAANLTLGAKPVDPVALTVKTAWPTEKDYRAIADLRVSPSGEIYVSSVSDPGDDGPFDSAIYLVGRLERSSKGPILVPNSVQLPVSIIPGYKIEAMDFDSTGRQLVFATDDEALGASIAWYQK